MNRWRQTSPIWFIVWAALLSSAGFSQDEIIRIDTNLVNIPVTIFDRDGRYVIDVRGDEFEVFEDGVKQELAYFGSIDHPITVFLLLDVSGSMSRQAREMGHAASAFVQAMRPDDQLIASSFSYHQYPLLSLTRIRDLRKGITLRMYPLETDTLVFDAVDSAMKQMRSIRGRKAIVLFSDGMGHSLAASAKSNLRDAEEQEASIYTIQFGRDAVRPYADPKALEKWKQSADEYMSALAQKTGGRRLVVEDIANLSEAFLTVAAELCRQYSLGYYSSTPGKQGDRRSIKIKVNRSGVAVRARNEVVYNKPKK